MEQLSNLQALFDFTADDLQEARAGRLSARLRERVREERLAACIDSTTMLLLLPWLLLVGLCGFTLILLYSQSLGPLVCAALAILIALLYAISRIGLPLTRGLLVWSVRRGIPIIGSAVQRRLAADRRQWDTGAVQRKTGRLTFPSDGEHQYIMLGGAEWGSSMATDTDERLWKLKPGKHYAIYTIPETEWIVAIEPLAGSSSETAH